MIHSNIFQKSIALYLISATIGMPVGMNAWARSGDATPQPPVQTRPPSPSPVVGPVQAHSYASPVTELHTPASFHVNALSIRKQLLPGVGDTNSGNISLLNTLLQVQDSRDTVTEKRLDLLPGLDVTAAVKVVSSGPTFLLTLVDVLLPFLMPSNWFNLYAQRSEFEAERVAYQIMELNTYAQALAIYYTALADQKSQALYAKEAADLGAIAQTWQTLYSQQLVSETTVLQSQANAQQAEINASQNAELVASETASVRQMLGSPIALSTKLILDDQDVPASPYEDWTPTDAQAVAIKKAPEFAQINYLLNAADDLKWATVFGFVSSTTLGVSTSNGLGHNPSEVSGDMVFGLAEIPEITISNRSMQEIQTQIVDESQAMGEVIESGINSIAQSKNQLSLAEQAESALEKTYDGDLTLYNQQLLSYTDLLIARQQWTVASISRVRAQLDLNLQRVNLHRTMLGFEFANIKGCGVQPKQSLGVIGSIFGSTESNHTLDELCREGGANPALATAN